MKYWIVISQYGQLIHETLSESEIVSIVMAEEHFTFKWHSLHTSGYRCVPCKLLWEMSKNIEITEAQRLYDWLVEKRPAEINMTPTEYYRLRKRIEATGIKKKRKTTKHTEQYKNKIAKHIASLTTK